RRLGIRNAAAAGIADVPGAEVAGADAEAWTQLVLYRHRALPVGVLPIPSAQHARRVARPDELTEGQVRPRTALTVGHRIAQIAIGSVIAIRVVPRARRRARQVVGGIAGGGANDVRVVANRRLQRGLAVAEQ